MSYPNADDAGDMAVAPHRLTLSAAELARVFRSIDAAVPEGFGTEVADEELPPAGAALLERGVLAAGDDGRVTPVASVAANVATLTAPVASVQVEVSIHGAGLRSRYAVQGPFGASLITLPHGAAELSFFPAELLGRELTRAVPATDTTVESKIARALDGLDAMPAAPLSGLLPLAALADYGPARALDAQHGARNLAAELGLSAQEAVLARQVADRTDGMLTCAVFGVVTAGQAAVGQVVWLATDHGGWTGLRPEPDGTDRRMVRLVPVERDDLGVWIAPLLAQILQVAP